MTTPEELIAAVPSLLGDNGERWHKGTTYSDDGMKMCLLGGIDKARAQAAHGIHFDTRERHEINRAYLEAIYEMDVVAQEMFPDRIDATEAISRVAQINDHSATVFTDVLAILEKTRIKLEERVTP